LNHDIYSVSAMCDVLKLSRNTYYYELHTTETETVVYQLTNDLISIFKTNRKRTVQGDQTKLN